MRVTGSQRTASCFYGRNMSILLLAAWFHCTLNMECIIQNDYGVDALSTGPLTHLFAHSLAPLTHLFAPHHSHRLRAPLRSFVRLLAHSLTPKLVGKRKEISDSFNP